MTIQLDSPDVESSTDRMTDEPVTGATTVEAMLDEISALDAQIVAAVQRRTELTRRAGLEARDTDAQRATQAHEMGALDRFADLGDDGRALAMALLRLARTA